jgi:hypothetical protein
MAKRDELMQIAADCRLPILTIDSLIERRQREAAVQRTSLALAAGA